MPTPIPIIAASCGDQSTTSISRVPITAISDRLTTIANSALSSGSPMATTPSVRNSTIPATSDAEDLAGAALLGRRPVDDVAAERHLDPALAVERERVLGHRLDLRGIDVAGRLAELDPGERDPAVLRDGRALGERVADGEHLGRLRDLAADRLDLRAVAVVSTPPWSTAKTTVAVSPDCAGNFSLSRS